MSWSVHCGKVGHTKPKCFDLVRNRNRCVSTFTNNFSNFELSELMMQVSVLSQQIQIVNQKLNIPVNQKLN